MIEILFGAAYCWILERCSSLFPPKGFKFYENCEVKVGKRQTGADHKQNPMLIKQLGHSDTGERIEKNE